MIRSSSPTGGVLDTEIISPWTPDDIVRSDIASEVMAIPVPLEDMLFLRGPLVDQYVPIVVIGTRDEYPFTRAERMGGLP